MFNIRFLSLLSLTLVAAGCTDPEPWPNARRYAKAETSVVYEAAQGAAENIAAAWSPGAVLPVSETRMIYASRGTRKLIELDSETGIQRTLFDLSPFEDNFSSSLWGSGLYLVDDWLIVATPAQKLIFCHRITGQIETVGMLNPPHAVLPADGVRLDHIDFGLFGGISPSPDGVYLALGNQVFHATWDGKQPNVLAQTALEHIAGTWDADDSYDSHDALRTPLSLHAYTHFAHKDGWVYFWSMRLLKAVKDGVMVNITGHGYASPSGELDTFFAFALPSDPPLIEHRGIFYTPYWDDSPALLRIEITNINVVTHEVSGSLYDIYPQSGKLTSVAAWGENILSADISAGSFWRFAPRNHPTDIIQTTRIFGPESAETRFESISTDPDSPYEPHDIIAPQAIATFKQDAYHLVYAPTLKRLSLLNAGMQKQAPIWEGSLTHIATDGHQRAWFANAGTFYFFELAENMTIQLSRVPSFFKPAPIMGVPCDRSRFKLTHPAKLETAADTLLLFIPQASRVLRYDILKDEAQFLHEGGWYTPSQENPSFTAGAIKIHTAEQWKANQDMEALILQDNNEQYLAVINLKSSKNLTVAGQKLAPNRGIILAGGGTQPIAHGLALPQTDFEQIQAMALTPEQSVVVATAGGLFETTDEGIWQAWDICRLSGLPQPPEWLEITGRAGNRMIFSQAGGQFYACAETPIIAAGMSLTTEWQSSGNRRAEPCAESSKIVTYDNIQHQTCLYDTDVPSSAPKCQTVPQDFEVLDMACDDSALYLSGQALSDDQNHILHTSFDTFQTFSSYLGMGSGLPDEAVISDVTLGMQLGRMVTDGIPWLYLWMKDTCTIWKLPAFRDDEIEADTPVYRLMTDHLLCKADAFAVTQVGRMAVAVNQTLYEIDGTDWIPLGTTGHDILDMIAVGHGFVLMTTDGIYLWEKGRMIKRAPNSMLIDGNPVKYTKRSKAWPQMTQSPGENAVLVPVFEGDRIVKIAL